MTCNCGSNKLLSVSGKTSDMCSVNFNDGENEHRGDGYVPYLGIGGGDYMKFKVCMECGTIQNWKSLKDKQIIQAIKEM